MRTERYLRATCRVLVLCTLCVVCGQAGAQADSNTDRYHRLLDRAIAIDTTLTTAEYKELYYGYDKHPGYKPGHYSHILAAMDSAMAEKQFQEAARLGEDLFRKAPFMVGVAFTLYTAYSELGKFQKARMYQWHFQKMLALMTDTGDGTQPSKPLLMLYEEDIPYLLQYFDVEASQHKLNEKNVMVYTLREPNNRNLRKLYFNVERPRSYFIVNE